MALIKCPECGKEISDKATSCIHCGYPIENEKDRNTQPTTEESGKEELSSEMKTAIAKKSHKRNVFFFGGSALGVVLIILLILIFLIPQSAEKVAQKWVVAIRECDYSAERKYCGYDHREYARTHYGNMKSFLEKNSRFFDYYFGSYKEYEQYFKRETHRILYRDYGKYSINAEVLYSYYIKPLTEESYLQLRERHGEYRSYNINDDSEMMVVRVVRELKGEYKNEVQTIDVYLLKIHGKWKVIGCK